MNHPEILNPLQRGDEIIVGKDSHIHRWEQGNYAQFAGEIIYYERKTS